MKKAKTKPLPNATCTNHRKNQCSRGLGCKRPQTGEALQSKMKDLSRKMPVLGIPRTPIRHRILKNQRFLKVGTQKREDLPRGSSRQQGTFRPLPVPWCDRNVHDPTTLRDVSVLPQMRIQDFPETIPPYLNFDAARIFSHYPKKLSYSSRNA